MSKTNNDLVLYNLNTWLYVERDINESLVKIADAGFQRLEMCANQAHLDPRLDPDIVTIKKLVDELGLQICSIHTPFSDLRLGYPDPSMEGEWLRVMGASLELGAELGAEVAVVHVASHEQDLAADLIEKSIEITTKFIEKLGQRAKELGMRLALENLLLGHAPRFALSLTELCKLFPDPDIGFCLDIGHAAIAGNDIGEEIRAAGQRLLSVHINNNDGVQDVHWLPTKGIINWQEVKNELAATGFEGLYVLEIRGDNEPDGVLDQLRPYASSVV